MESNPEKKEMDYAVADVNGSEICVEQDGVKYFYKKGLLKTNFERLETEVETNLDDVIDHKGKITIANCGKDLVEVIEENDRAVTYANGKTGVFKECIRFTCAPDFSKDSIDPLSAGAMLGKADKYYDTITGYYISQDRLCELYDRAMEIGESLK